LTPEAEVAVLITVSQCLGSLPFGIRREVLIHDVVEATKDGDKLRCSVV
jgi:hypothetical protein